MAVKDGDSVMTCGAVLAQMPKSEKHFANTVPCDTGLSSQSHCSHFQTKTGHFYIVCQRLIVDVCTHIYIDVCIYIYGMSHCCSQLSTLTSSLVWVLWHDWDVTTCVGHLRWLQVLTFIPDISTALMRPRRPKQYCLQLDIALWLHVQIEHSNGRSHCC